MHEVLDNRLGGLSLPRKSVVRLTDRPDMTLDVYSGRKTTMQHSSDKISYLTLFQLCAHSNHVKNHVWSGALDCSVKLTYYLSE